MRILRNDVRIKLELARIQPSEEWTSLESRLRRMENEASGGAVLDEAVRDLERFDRALPQSLLFH